MTLFWSPGGAVRPQRLSMQRPDVCCEVVDLREAKRNRWHGVSWRSDNGFEPFGGSVRAAGNCTEAWHKLSLYCSGLRAGCRVTSGARALGQISAARHGRVSL